MSTVKRSEKWDTRDCIQCGLCLESCPTYRETRQEGLSARGRIILIRDLMAGAEGLSTPRGARTAEQLLDLCLVCRSCEAACPSGVRYGDLITTARGELPRTQQRRHERLVRFCLRYVFMHPWITRLVLRVIKGMIRTGLARALVAGSFRRADRKHFHALIDAVQQSRASETEQLRARLREGRAREPASDSAELSRFTPSDRVLIFQGCVTPVVFPAVMEAFSALLRRFGADQAVPKGQVCCGALHQHHGDLARARTLARKNIAAFEAAGAGLILAEAAGCGAALKAYGDLLADDPDYAERAARFAARVRDATEVLAQWPAPPQGAQSGDPLRVVLQEPCHLRHVQRASDFGKRLLDAMPGVQRLEASEEDLCCGSAGIYNLLEPTMAAALGDRKVAALASAAPEVVVTTNPGCRLQIAGRLAARGIITLHLLEVCDLIWPNSSDSGGGREPIN